MGAERQAEAGRKNSLAQGYSASLGPGRSGPQAPGQSLFFMLLRLAPVACTLVLSFCTVNIRLAFLDPAQQTLRPTPVKPLWPEI